ncbi:hypothetical protein [Pedobacter sp. MC2016-24]|uniref:hypothetical protein n=1 Tax=Pedobacter sp. MC2016-24 TaxID=2780090 RepID=UPI0018810D61|nr:hypothetical protein [Pedobacter sp. MC2016-24]MBE9597863.1 hypothetical protein [Pedobacter sp. MC2016-24]
MGQKEVKQVSKVLIKLGNILNENPSFLYELDEFLDKSQNIEMEKSIDEEKINSIDLFKLIREKTEDELDIALEVFNIKELREILKKYRFGSPSKLRSTSQIRGFIINQLKQRKTDVFQIQGANQESNIENKDNGLMSE